MASYSVARAKSTTLSANTVDTITVTGAFASPGGIEVINRSQTGTIWVRLDGTAPTVGGDNCHPVLGTRFFENPWAVYSTNAVVKLISDAALAYTVESAPDWART